MATIDFVFSNPAHHRAMMHPVAGVLQARGHECRLVSLAELRGFKSPPANGTPVLRAIPFSFRSSPNVGDSLGEATSGRRKLVQQVAWRVALGPRMHYLLRKSSLVVVPNDAVFPYAPLAAALARSGRPFVLMQEGIRFPLPNEREVAVYGRAGAAAICCWGDAAAEHFRAIGAAAASVVVTGNPRYDAVRTDDWRAAGEQLRARLGLAEPPLLFLSNPIDDQGFCSLAEKMQLFEQFAAQVSARGVPLLVKLHPREDAAAFRRTAERARKSAPIHVVDDAPLFAILAAGRAAVVLASTVGLEALLFGLPLGVLAIPRHGHAFRYVADGAAVALAANDDAALDRLLAGAPAAGAGAMLERYLAHRGHAAERVADTIEAQLR
jgi:capsular polysaccharide biosynthesis protein